MRLLLSIVIAQFLAHSSSMFSKNEEDKIRDIVHEEFLRKDMGRYVTEKVLARRSKTEEPPEVNEDLLKVIAEDSQGHPDNRTEPGESNSIDLCIDMYDSDKCRELRDDFDMCDKDRMKAMCADTCGYCPSKAHAYVDCKQTKYGCCPDKVTPKSDPIGTGCNTCLDKSPELCQGNEDDCNSIDWVGNWMKKNCKKTCGACEETNRPAECEDDKEQHRFCLSWKKQGLCTEVEELMIKHCRKTCELCEKISSNHAVEHKRR